MNILLKWFQKALASLFFIGYIPGMPGTLGSLAATAVIGFIYWKAPAFLSPQYLHYHWLILACLVALSIILSSKPKEIFGDSDPKQVIIDEFAGQCITFFMISISWPSLLLGFALFRFFDIIKPFPIYKMEEIEGGVGVTMDDVMAGFFANLSLTAIIFCYHVIHAALLRQG
jgi:phosphatidylglycerophosphatase A